MFPSLQSVLASRPVSKVLAGVGLALLAAGGIATNARPVSELTRSQVAVEAIAASGYLSPWSEGIDWTRVAAATITPGETVGAYER